jgi:8-hydroxy-5-deazaflavin:NADPH oxidoreductase
MAPKIGFIGGTGPEGKGLAARFALADCDVIIGSRAAGRGEEAATELRSAIEKGNLRGATNADAAAEADIVVVTIPYAGLRETLEGLKDALAGKIVVSAVVPLRFSKGRVSLIDIAEGSAGQETQAVVPGARVVGAFQTLSAGHLMDVLHPMEGDVLVCGDDDAAVREVMTLAETIRGIRGVNAGALSNCHFVEGLTALLIGVNRIHKVESGIQIVGI